jgi:hypothetical protein
MATANPTGRRTGYSDGAGTTTTRTEKGISLARGPALILGTILVVVGLYLLYKAHTFPKFSNLPNGTAPRDGKFLFGLFAANGWTVMLTAAGGALLLFGAAQHLLAKTMSLIVGVALGAAAVIALASGNVLGMASANGWTELGWGASAVILLFNTLIPRRRRTVEVVEPAGRGTVAERGPVATETRRDGDATAVRRDDATAVRGDDATAVRRDDATAVRGDDATAVRRDDGTAVRRDGGSAAGEEPLVTRRADEPVAERRPVDPAD